MRINAITPCNYRSNLNKCTKPCKNNDTPLSEGTIREPMKQGLSFGKYESEEANKRIHAAGHPFYIGMPEDPLAVSPFVFVYVDPDDNKLKARLNKELIKKRGADEYCAEKKVYEVFKEGHPDNITTMFDVDKIATATGYTHERFANVHCNVVKIAEEHGCDPGFIFFNYDKFIKFKGADEDGLTLNFEFSRNPFEVDRELPNKKGFFAAIERFVAQGEMQEAKMKNAEVNDIICGFEEKHGLSRGWEVAPMDCRTEDGVKRFKLILELYRELHEKMYPPEPPSKSKPELSPEELRRQEELIADRQRFGMDWPY